MSKFIEGFWDAEGNYTRGEHGGEMVNYGLDESKDIIIVAGEMGDIALINNTYPEEEQQATANLIAAVPDMYNALLEIIGLNRQTARDKYGDEEIAELWGCVVLARKAIAKAEG